MRRLVFVFLISAPCLLLPRHAWSQKGWSEDKALDKLRKEMDKLAKGPEDESERLLKEIRKEIEKALKPFDEDKFWRDLEKGPKEPKKPGWIDGLFRDHDRNTDGLLDYDEMTPELRAERGRFDANRDGFIDRGEYETYLQARREKLMADQGLSLPERLPLLPRPPVNRPPEPPARSRAPVPAAELPEWFRRLDTDADGQVGLYEWKAGDWSLSLFDRIDRNCDGFLTATEVLRYLALARQQPDLLAEFQVQASGGKPRSDKPRGAR